MGDKTASTDPASVARIVEEMVEVADNGTIRIGDDYFDDHIVEERVQAAVLSVVLRAMQPIVERMERAEKERKALLRVLKAVRAYFRSARSRLMYSHLEQVMNACSHIKEE